MKTFGFFKLVFALMFLNLTAAFGEEASLTIQTKSEKKIFGISNLLNRSDVEILVVKNDPAYPGQEQKYKAVKVTNLFDGMAITDDAVIQFKALDGFSAPLLKQRLLNKSAEASIAYVAIESPTEKWPPLKPSKPSAGPFYLVWKNPELSQISPEEWPYMLAAFEVKDTLEAVYPKIFPNENLSKNGPITKGFNLFVKNCFACHTMNKSGSSQVGPDLNIPMNPTEYFQQSVLKKLIRNPQDIRHWPNSRMKGFGKDILTDQDLDHLISYLKHMTKNKL